MELFHKLELPQFSKTAAMHRLQGDGDAMESELLSMLYRQHGFLTKMQVSLKLTDVDETRGYAKGWFTVTRNAIPLEAQGKAPNGMFSPPPQPDPKATVIVPVIVDSRKVYTFDVFQSAATGKFYPLTEERVNRMLPQTPSVLTVKKSNLPVGIPDEAGSGVSPTAPGSSGGYGTMREKVGSFITKEQAISFLEKVAADQGILDAAVLNEDFGDYVRMVAAVSEQEKVASVATRTVVPVHGNTAMVVAKVPRGYRVKTASAPEGVFYTNAEAQTSIRASVRDAAMSSAVLITPGVSNPLRMVKAASVGAHTGSGYYRVMFADGIARPVMAFDKVASIGGKVCAGEMLLASAQGTRRVSAVPGERLGDLDVEKLGSASDISAGVGYLVHDGVAHGPVSLEGGFVKEGMFTARYSSGDLMGRGFLHMTSVRRPTPVPGTPGDYLFPKTARFVPISEEALPSPVSVVEKVSSAAVSLRRVGHEYEFVDGERREVVGEEDALLSLARHGDSARGAMSKLASARQGVVVRFIPREYRPNKGVLQEKLASAHQSIPHKRAAAQIAKQIHCDLVKEAAALQTGKDTVDSVLSLGFITPESIGKYVSLIDDMEASLEKLCELLIATRLGIAPSAEAPVLSSIKGLDRAVAGLRQLEVATAIQQNRDNQTLNVTGGGYTPPQ